VTYRFLSPAQQDLVEAIEYYENASSGLGLEFLDEVERTVSRILLHPEAWTSVGEHHRRCRMRRFPYGLLYSCVCFCVEIRGWGGGQFVGSTILPQNRIKPLPLSRMRNKNG